MPVYIYLLLHPGKSFGEMTQMLLCVTICHYFPQYTICQANLSLGAITQSAFVQLSSNLIQECNVSVAVQHLKEHIVTFLHSYAWHIPFFLFPFFFPFLTWEHFIWCFLAHLFKHKYFLYYIYYKYTNTLCSV